MSSGDDLIRESDQEDYGRPELPDSVADALEAQQVAHEMAEIEVLDGSALIEDVTLSVPGSGDPEWADELGDEEGSIETDADGNPIEMGSEEGTEAAPEGEVADFTPQEIFGSGTPVPDAETMSQFAPARTKQAFEHVGEDRHAEATAALTALAQAIVAEITALDFQHGVYRYLKELRIECQGNGMYWLYIVDDRGETRADIAEAIAADNRPKGGRIIQLRD